MALFTNKHILNREEYARRIKCGEINVDKNNTFIGSLKQIVVKGFFWMSLTSLSINLTQFIVKILLARLLVPDDFGVVAIALSVLNSINLFQDFGFGVALIQRKKDADKAFNSVFTFVLVLSVVFSILLALFSKSLAGYFNDARLTTIILLLALTLPSGAVSIPYSSYISKNLLFYRRFTTMSASLLFGNLLSLALAFLGFGYMSIVLGYLTASILYLVLLIILTPWRPKFCFDFVVFKQIVNYGKYVFFANFAAILLSQGDNFVVGKILGTTQLGYYAVAYALATLPAVNIAHTITAVIFPTFAKLQDDAEVLVKCFIKSITLVNIVVFPVAFGTIIIAPFVFHNLIGEKWLPAQTAFILLSFAALFRSLAAVPSYFLLGTGRSRIDLQILISSAIIAIIFIVPSTKLFGIVGTSTIMSIAYASVSIMYLIKSVQILNISRKTILKTFLPVTLASSFMVFAGFIMRDVFLKGVYGILNLSIVILFCCAAYSFILGMLHKKLLPEIKTNLLLFFNRNQ